MIIEVEYLHNNSGNHDKVYNVAIQKNNNRYEVVAEWGARLGVLKTDIKYSGMSEIEATATYNKTVNSKLSKGYKTVSQSASIRSVLSNVPVIRKPKKPNEKPEPEPYNPDALPERRFDLDL